MAPYFPHDVFKPVQCLVLPTDARAEDHCRQRELNQVLRIVSGNLESIQRWFDQFHFVMICPREMKCEWRSVRVDNFGSLSALGLPNFIAPFFARANQASAAASIHSTSPRTWSSINSSNQSPSTMPIRIYSSKRRQHVRGKGKHFGNCDHWHPVISTYMIPPSRRGTNGMGVRHEAATPVQGSNARSKPILRQSDTRIRRVQSSVRYP